MSIFLKIIILPLVVVQRHGTPLPSSKSLFFICSDIFKLQAAINVNGSDKNSLPRTAYTLICKSECENLLWNVSELHWKRHKCNIAGRKIECPLFKQFKTYSDFMLWKTTTFLIKIVYEVNGTEFVTLSRPVTPYLHCRNSTRIVPNDKMFKLDQNHNRKCCPC